MRNSCDACVIKVMLKKYAFGEGCACGGEEKRLECARKEYNGLVLLRRTD